jgi:hypothetical protein
MILSLASLALSLTPALPLPQGGDPELFDPTVFRVFEVQFAQSNWWNTLEGYYNANNGQMLEADLTVDGITYNQVGVAFKGNSSFFGLPNNSQKASFSIQMDYVVPDQELYGVDTMNLNNGFQDPTFMREVLYGNLGDPFVPMPRGAFTRLEINGASWGVYPLVEQIDKKFLRDNFESDEGVRWKVPGNTNDPNANAFPLLYLGTNPNVYDNGYTLKTEGATNPWDHLIETCDVLNNTTLAQLEDQIDEVFSVDRAMWVILIENIFMDDDSYIRKGADYALYWNDYDERMNLMQRDGNEAFGTGSGSTWPGPSLYELNPFYHQGATNRPVLNRLLAIQDFRQRYLAHYRTLIDQMWRIDVIGPLITQYAALIDAEVQADTKKLFSYSSFVNGLVNSVSIGGNGIAPGLEAFVVNRRTFLLNHAEIGLPAPSVSSVSHDPVDPAAGETCWVTADVDGPNAPIGEVRLYWRTAGDGSYDTVNMLDDGAHHDGLAGDGVFGVALPVSSSGAKVEYYVRADSTPLSGGASFFWPRTPEYTPLEVEFELGTSSEPVRITEYMYKGVGGEFLEITNMGSSSISLSGWSIDDQSGTPGTVTLSGNIAAGQSKVITESDSFFFALDWGISGSLVLDMGDNSLLGRNDTIYIFDANGDVVDKLSYGDEDFAGSVRTNGISATGCSSALGTNNPFAWILASDGDSLGSFTAGNGFDIGSPGVYTSPTTGCSSGAVGTPFCFGDGSGTPCPCSNTGPSGQGCANSTGNGGLLTGTGTDSVAVGNLVLNAVNLLPNQPILFFQGNNAVNSGNGNVFGAGLRCAGGGVIRLQVIFAGAAGGASTTGNIPASAGVSPGDLKRYQGWYRNPGGPCSASFNLTQGLEISWGA